MARKVGPVSPLRKSQKIKSVRGRRRRRVYVSGDFVYADVYVSVCGSLSSLILHVQKEQRQCSSWSKRYHHGCGQLYQGSRRIS